MYLDINAVGSRIKEKREALGWSQEYLAERSHYSKQHIGNIERGKANASIEGLVHLSNALNTTPDGLLIYIENNTKEYIISEIIKTLTKATDSQLKVIADTLPAFIQSWNMLEEKNTV